MKINSQSKRPIILEIIGYSGAGKTTLIEKLIPALRKRGVRLAVIKHTSHHHELDRPGKDSHRLRKAGAEAVVVSSPKMVAMFREVKREWPIKRLLRHLPKNIDLVIAEGFRSAEHPCLEVFRHGFSPNLKCRDHHRLLAVVGDDPGDLNVPHFHRDAVRAITKFLLTNLSWRGSFKIGQSNAKASQSAIKRQKRTQRREDAELSQSKPFTHPLRLCGFA